MELGARIKAARLEKGLSQRQLCGDTITRNMLSQIENGSARPSMATLQFLARQLEKPMSYFLEEEAVSLPNRTCILRARQAFCRGDAAAARAALQDFREPDELLEPERGLLWYLTGLALAEQAITDSRLPYAATLLRELETINCPYITPELQRRRLILLGQTGTAVILPDDDDALLLRAENALSADDPGRCLVLLDAMEHRQTPRWHLLHGHADFQQTQYARAAEHYRLAETAFPKEVLPRLEVCYRELGDYKLAYEYACRQKNT